VPERDGSSGQEAVELAASVGWFADTEQRLMIDAMLSERAGKWAAFETAVIEPRQNGKTDSGQVASLYDLFVRKVSRIVWTAHKYKTCADTFAWFAGVCENYDHLRKRVYKVTAGVGEQSIKLLPRFTGPTMDFLARSTGGGRGLDGDITNLDEALYLNPTMMGALVPIMSAKPNPQLRYFSSSGLLASEVLRGLRDRGRAGGDPSLMYAEWGCPQNIACVDPKCSHLNGSEGCVLDDLDFIKIGNPAAGGRITEDYLRGERRAFGSSMAMLIEHMRERMGWWEDPPTASEEKLFPLWPKRRDTGSIALPGSRMALGMDTSWDRSATWVAAATELPNGRVRAEIVATGPGQGWVRSWLFGDDPSRMTRLAPVGVAMQASGAPVSTLHEELGLHAPAAQREALRGFTAADMARASGLLFDLIDRDGISIVAHPALDAAAADAVAKPMSDAWVIDRKKSASDSAPLVALSAAVAALVGNVEEETPPPPNCW
jgi:hypothetical protein